MNAGSPLTSRVGHGRAAVDQDRRLPALAVDIDTDHAVGTDGGIDRLDLDAEVRFRKQARRDVQDSRLVRRRLRTARKAVQVDLQQALSGV